MPDKISKFIASLNEKMRNQLKKKLELLRSSPFKVKGVKKMEGLENTYRLRMGKIRVIYRIIQGQIEIADIDYRGNIY